MKWSSSSSSSSNAKRKRNSKLKVSPVMSRLPVEIIELILAFVPLAVVSRLRLACRKWNSFITSDDFIRKWSACRGSNHPLVYSMAYEDNRHGVIYDPVKKEWQHQSLTKLTYRKNLIPVGSGGGLICFRGVLDCRAFLVCNPLINAVRVLPVRPGPARACTAAGMILNGEKEADGFKVMFLGSDGELEVYDSKTDTWTYAGGIPNVINIRFTFCSRTIITGTKMHFLRKHPDAVVSYDLASNSWEQLLVPMPEQFITFYELAVCDDKILLIAVTDDDVYSLRVWQLNRETLSWEQISETTPNRVRGVYKFFTIMRGMGNHELPMVALIASKKAKLLTFDMKKKGWDDVPQFWSSAKGSIRKIDKTKINFSGVTFHPSFASP